MDILKRTDIQRAVVGEMILFLEDLEKSLRESRDEIIHSTSCPESSGSSSLGGGGFSDKTQSRALRLEKQSKIEMIAKITREAINELPWIHRLFVKLRQKNRHYAGQHGWTNTVAGQMCKICLEHNRTERVPVARQTFYDWWDEILSAICLELALKGHLSKKCVDDMQYYLLSCTPSSKKIV